MQPEPVARISLPTFSDGRGSLSVVDFAESVPFPVKRAFYIYDVPPDAVRGGHATYSPQLLICVAGGCTVTLHDGERETVERLASPGTGLCLPPLTWRTLSDFSDGCVLLCLSDRPYDRNDYINDFDEYLQKKRRHADRKGVV